MRNPDSYYSDRKGWIKTCKECLRKRKEKRARIMSGDTQKRSRQSTKEEEEGTLDSGESGSESEEVSLPPKKAKRPRVESPINNGNALSSFRFQLH